MSDDNLADGCDLARAQPSETISAEAMCGTCGIVSGVDYQDGRVVAVYALCRCFGRPPPFSRIAELLPDSQTDRP